LVGKGSLRTIPLRCAVAAVSAGVVDGTPLLDLPYEEDSKAALDFNLVMTEEGEFVEVQGTGESHPFTRDEMNEVLDLGESGIRHLFEFQQQALAAAGVPVPQPAA
jgi:ribonuclease PH